MKRRNSMLVAMVFLALVLPGWILAENAGDGDDAGTEDVGREPRMVWRIYSVHFLDLRQAGLMLEERIPEMLEDPQFEVRYEGVGSNRPGEGKPQGYLRILTTEAAHQQIVGVLAETDRPPETRLFNIVVLQSTDDPQDTPDLAPDARQALQDLRSMLPYKGYKLVDSAMVRSSGHSDVSLGSRYALEFYFHVGPSEEKPLQVERFVLYSQIDNKPRHMDTAFSMGIGETVVVGTSRPFDEDQALVVLLTALE
jgi:hypothetical protein